MPGGHLAQLDFHGRLPRRILRCVFRKALQHRSLALLVLRCGFCQPGSTERCSRTYTRIQDKRRSSAKCSGESEIGEIGKRPRCGNTSGVNRAITGQHCPCLIYFVIPHLHCLQDSALGPRFVSHPPLHLAAKSGRHLTRLPTFACCMPL